MAFHARRRKPSWPSVKGPMSGHPPICPETLVADEKPDTMIAGRKYGRPSGPGDERPDQASLPRQLSAAPINPQNPTPLNDQNDMRRRLVIAATAAKAW